eukprot:1195113-Prorocentrum_minimum.AAC.3
MFGTLPLCPKGQWRNRHLGVFYALLRLFQIVRLVGDVHRLGVGLGWFPCRGPVGPYRADHQKHADAGEWTPSAGEWTPSAGELTPSAGELTPSAGEFTHSAGELTPSAGELTRPGTCRPGCERGV